LVINFSNSYHTYCSPGYYDFAPNANYSLEITYGQNVWKFAGVLENNAHLVNHLIKIYKPTYQQVVFPTFNQIVVVDLNR
jgi:hypothetical protein